MPFPPVKGYLIGAAESGPAIGEIEARAEGGTVTTMTMTTASTNAMTTVHYEPLSGQVYFLVNDKSGTVLSLSAADQSSVVGSIHRGLDEQVCSHEGRK